MIQPTPYENLNVIPSEVNLSGSEIDLAHRPDRLQVVRNVLQAIRDANVFDYILLDCPPSLGILMTSTLAAADGILVPMQAEYYALEGVSHLMRTINKVKGNLNDDLSLSTILLTMFDPRTNLSREVADEVRRHFPEQTLDVEIPRSVKIAEAPGFGQTIITYQPKNVGAIAYQEAAEQIAKRAERADG